MVNGKIEEKKDEIIQSLNAAIADRETFINRFKKPPSPMPDYLKGPMQF